MHMPKLLGTRRCRLQHAEDRFRRMNPFGLGRLLLQINMVFISMMPMVIHMLRTVVMIMITMLITTMNTVMSISVGIATTTISITCAFIVVFV